MNILCSLIKRNCKLFFKDKAMFFTSMITPAILLVLYTTFLRNVFKDSFLQAIPEGMKIPEKIINGLVSGQLVSSLLAVSSVTVAFCSNLLMVQDKVTGAAHDISMTPVKKSTLALGYYISSFISTIIICFVATGLCFIYIGKTGWYLTSSDVFHIILDVVLLALFGTALSSIINVFLSTQGQISAVGTIVSSGYGFICGAYMPLSMLGKGIRNVVSFLPGTYGTALMRNHAMNSAFDKMANQNLPDELIENMKKSVDCYPEFLGNVVKPGAMYAVLGGTVVILIIIYIVINMTRNKKSV